MRGSKHWALEPLERMLGLQIAHQRDEIAHGGVEAFQESAGEFLRVGLIGEIPNHLQRDHQGNLGPGVVERLGVYCTAHRSPSQNRAAPQVYRPPTQNGG